VLFVLVVTLPGSNSPAPESGFDDADCRVRSISFSVNGTPAPLVTVRRGDHVVVAFDVPNGCVDRLTFASFVAPAPAFDGSKLREQARYSRASGAFGAGRHSMAVDVFGFPGSKIPDCSSVPASAPDAPERHGENARVTFKGGANRRGSYTGACDGAPSENGNGGNGRGKPCAGCVGNADEKNPPGQQPGGNDHNAGYECDRNHGIGRGNPAHSSCQNFQVDFAYRPSSDDKASVRGHSPALVAGVFCVRSSSQVCYTTDRTGSDAVLGS
jgi:hypothetical protein